MNRIEDRLRRAAAETRNLADSQRPAPLANQKRAGHNRGVFAFAAAFAVVLFVFGFLPLLLESDPDSTPTETAPLASPGSTAASSTSLPDAVCSSADFEGQVGSIELPGPVATTRAAIVADTLVCDFDGLETTADSDFLTSFGGGDAASLREWETEGRGELDTLLELLHMSYEVIEMGDGRAIYVWPSAYAYESWDEVPAGAVAELGAIHTQDEIESFDTANQYLGWRTAIDSEGRWLYFISGD